MASLEFYRKASFLKVSVDHPAAMRTPQKRGDVSHFTPGARRRMMDLMAKLENDVVPFMVTLTYPDEFPLYHEAFKNHLDLLGQRLRRRWPTGSIIWKLEFKVRKSGENAGKAAPHYHLFVYGVPWEFRYKQEIGEFYSVKGRIDSDGTEWFNEVGLAADGEHFVRACSTDYDRPDGKPESGLDSVKQWMTRNWYDLVGSNDFKHYKAGTRVERLRSVMGAFYYASKAYIGKTEDDLKLENKPGRFWGVIGRANLKLGKREVLEISAKQGFMIRRTIERYRRAKTKPERRKFLRRDLYIAKLYCNADYWVERLLKLVGVSNDEDRHLRSSLG